MIEMFVRLVAYGKTSLDQVSADATGAFVISQNLGSAAIAPVILQDYARIRMVLPVGKRTLPYSTV